MGVGFSQLRRTGKPIITALPISGGYKLDGFVPWITGYGIFSEFIVAAILPNRGSVFGIIPFRETKQSTGGMIKFSQPAKLAAMTSTNTVSSNISGYCLPVEQVIFTKTAGWMNDNDKSNILSASFLATGCAIAGLNIIAASSQQKSLPFITDSFVFLHQELANCRAAIRKAQKNSQTEFSEKMHLRSWAIELANRISHAAVVVSGGAANYSHHNAQRIYREALVFTVTGQTTAIMAATLTRLVMKEVKE
ncbi:MAG TPA: acyl-CoA dehydrogenase [Richelia sp.]|nr:acyl-CoA dehydrogenase [Richelia sp.]